MRLHASSMKNMSGNKTPTVRGTPAMPKAVITQIVSAAKTAFARNSSTIVPDPAKRNIERYIPRPIKIGGHSKKAVMNILANAAFQSCHSPTRNEKATQIAQAQSTQSSKNTTVRLVGRDADSSILKKCSTKLLSLFTIAFIAF